jgi:hypothetical protein
MANKYNKKELSDWFSGKVKTAVGYRRKIIGSVDRSRSSTVIGKMYFYWYDPKHKDTLPVYDRFPLVFPIERYSDGFLGLNLHYLNQAERAELLGKLMKFRSSSNLTERSKLKLSYELLSGTKRIANQMRPCIKRYLFTHVRSPFIEVPATEWDRAIELPVEFFVVKR